MNAWLGLLLAALPAAATSPKCALRPDQLEAYCIAAAADDCAAARRLFSRAAKLSDDVDRCAASGCDGPRALQLVEEHKRIDRSWSALPSNSVIDGVNDCLGEATKRLETGLAAELERETKSLPPAEDLERRLSALEALPPARRSRAALEAASRSADAMWAAWDRLARGLDAGELVSGKDISRDSANALAEKLAGWRDRLIRLYRDAGAPIPAASARRDADAAKLAARHAPSRLNLGALASFDELSGERLDPPAAPTAGAQANPYYRAPSAVTAKRPARLFQAPSPGKPEPPRLGPDIYGFTPGRFDVLVATGTFAARASTLTRVVGDPARRAAMLHRQSGQDCSIVSHQQILEAYGAVPAARPRDGERALSGDFWRRGYRSPLDNGTYMAVEGEALQDRGFLVIKRPKATADQLAQAARRGGMLIVDTNAEKLWSNPSEEGGHTVVVTGARLDASGRVLGYYINDSGDGSGKAARFVAVQDFLAAWRGRYVEVR